MPITVIVRLETEEMTREKRIRTVLQILQDDEESIGQDYLVAKAG